MKTDDLHLWALALHYDTRERGKKYLLVCAVIVEIKSR